MLYPWSSIELTQPKLEAILAGCGDDGFVGKTAHEPGMEGSGVFTIQWGAPSRNKAKCELFRVRKGLKKNNVHHDYKVVLRRAKKEAEQQEKPLPVFAISVDTPQHLQMIKDALEMGYVDIIVDKPIVVDLAEYLELRNLLSQHPKARIYLTLNHRYNAPVFQLRLECADAGPDGIETSESFMLQNWCCKRIKQQDGGFKQQNWRYSHPLASALDIATHEKDLLSFILNTPLESVSNAAMSRVGQHGYPVYDNGSCTFTFANGVEGKGQFHQALPEHINNIGSTVTFTRGRFMNKKLMWRMNLNGGNTLYVGRRDADPQNLLSGGWERMLERGSGDFASKVNEIFGVQPPGHGYDWLDFWLWLYRGIAGDIYRRRGVDRSTLHPSMQIVVPLSSDAGETTTRYVHAHDAAFAGSGSVRLDEVGNSYVAPALAEEEPVFYEEPLACPYARVSDMLFMS